MASKAKKAKSKRKTSSPRPELEVELSTGAANFRTWALPEPDLLFAKGMMSPDPKVGIDAGGPWGTHDGTPLESIRIGIVGTGDTISLARQFLSRCASSITAKPSDECDPYLFPSFPGSSPGHGFRCRLEFPEYLTETLNPREVDRIKVSERDAAVELLGRCVGNHLGALAEKESQPQLVFVALPTELRNVVGSGRRRTTRPRQPQSRSTNRQLVLFERPEPPTTAALSRTFHRVLKGEGMRTNLPTQLAWQTTLDGTSSKQDAATIAWNLCTAAYYKAGGVPWRATRVPRSTCYIGISFFQPIEGGGQLQTAMAQAFSDRGDGVVLRGNTFEWDRRTMGPPRLTRDAAEKLLNDLLASYEVHLSQPPARVVIHKSSRLSTDECDGFEAALGKRSISFFDFVSVSHSSIRFLRLGSEPPLRGTAIEVSPKHYVFYTRGYVPYLKVYPGLRIPNPLYVVHERGHGATEDVLGEILTLTKMNFNSADFASHEPITLDFARRVGLIMSELPSGVTPRTQYRFYM